MDVALRGGACWRKVFFTLSGAVRMLSEEESSMSERSKLPLELLT